MEGGGLADRIRRHAAPTPRRASAHRREAAAGEASRDSEHLTHTHQLAEAAADMLGHLGLEPLDLDLDR